MNKKTIITILLVLVARALEGCNANLSRHPLLVFLYSSIISAIGNVVNLMVGTSEFVGIMSMNR